MSCINLMFRVDKLSLQLFIISTIYGKNTNLLIYCTASLSLRNSHVTSILKQLEEFTCSDISQSRPSIGVYRYLTAKWNAYGLQVKVISIPSTDLMPSITWVKWGIFYLDQLRSRYTISFSFSLGRLITILILLKSNLVAASALITFSTRSFLVAATFSLDLSLFSFSCDFNLCYSGLVNFSNAGN